MKELHLTILDSIPPVKEEDWLRYFRENGLEKFSVSSSEDGQVVILSVILTPKEPMKNMTGGSRSCGSSSG